MDASPHTSTIINATTDPGAVRHAFRAALDAAVAFMGATAPNPPVGCALLDAEGQILVTAAHQRAGTLHAEARALSLARADGVIDRVRTAIVTLEPCNHTGRTPPCSEALRDSPVREVWVGVPDPHAAAAGGMARLTAAPDARRCIVLRDVPELSDLRQACEDLIAPFARRITDGRAWITVKQALDADGSMIPPTGRTTFSRPASLTLAHRLRRATDAIITGAGTVLADHPRFTVRHLRDHDGRAPRLLVLCDRRGRVPAHYVAEMETSGFRVLRCETLEAVPAHLAAHGANWAMIEAGPGLLREVARLGLWDDWLTIRTGAGRDMEERDAKDRDRWEVRHRGATPLRLLPESRDMIFDNERMN